MPDKRNIARELLIPKVNPLLMVQLTVYAIVGIIIFGTILTKQVRPGLAAWGITIETTADRQKVQSVQVKTNTAGIKCLEDRLGRIEGGVRALLEKVAPRERGHLASGCLGYPP